MIRMSANIKILIVDDDVYIGDMVAAAWNWVTIWRLVTLSRK